MRRLAFGAVVSVVVAGCSAGPPQTVPAATPAPAPAATASPDGAVTPVGAAVDAAVVDPVHRVLALLVRAPDRVLLLGLDDLDAPPRAVALPSVPAQLALAGDGGSLLVAVSGAVLRIDTSTGTLGSTPVDGDVTAVLQQPDGTIAAGLRSGSTVFLRPDGSVSATVAGLVEVDGLVRAGDAVVALDRRQSAAIVLQPDDESLGLALRAGEGATNEVADSYGRVLVTNTRGGELLAYSGDPLILRQRFPVPGAPYALAFDPRTDIAWITLTARNQVVGYYVRGGEPQERYRFATVAQPNSVTVDSASGTVFVGSATGAGVQRIAVSEVAP